MPKLKKFLEMARRFNPVNLGDARNGGALRPSRSMNPLSHWKREITPDFDAVIAGLDTMTTAAAVFDNRAGRGGLRQGGQGSGPRAEHQYLDLDRGRGAVLRSRGICAATASGYSLGFEGKTEHLPNEDVLKLATMCGHGMVSASLAKKMIDWVKEGRRTPEQAVSYLTRFCSCGVFNPARGKANSGRGSDADEVGGLLSEDPPRGFGPDWIRRLVQDLANLAHQDLRHKRLL